MEFSFDGSQSFKQICEILIHFIFNKGSRYSFAVERIFSRRLAYPFNNCIKDLDDFKYDKTIINYLKVNERIYTLELCYELCFELKFILKNECNCRSTLGLVSKECTLIKTDLECYRSKRDTFYDNSPRKSCSALCPIECDSNDLRITSSSFDYPVEGIVNGGDDHNLYKHFKAYDKVRENYSEFLVYYSDLQYTEIEELAKVNLSDLISNFGGTLGLFIGMSFLSFVEIFEIIIETGFILFSKKMNY